MTTTREKRKAQSHNAALADASGASDRSERHDSAPEASSTEAPRILQERHFVDADGQDDIEATDDRGRHWYHLRPEPRGRADVMGFGFTWWLFLIILIIAFLPWGWGY
jgi:hypothetical protein